MMEEKEINYSKVNCHIIISLALYFGWLLSFPFYGPVLHAAAPHYNVGVFSLPFVFTLSHALSFLLGGLVLKNVFVWKRLMVISLGVTIAVSMSLFLLPPQIWPWAMVVLGISAAVYIFGWTYPYTVFVYTGDRLKLMASVIIGANIIYILFNLISRIASPSLMLVTVGLPLWVAMPFLFSFPTSMENKKPLSSPYYKRVYIPTPLMLILCLFIAGLYLCSGFMYNIMQPFLSIDSPLFIYYRYIPYIAVLLIMRRFGKGLQRYFPIYMGVSLLGLSFVSFALVYKSTAGLFVTTSLIEAAFAFLDLFIWTTLGDLAFIYGAPFQFFGFALAAMLFSVLAGELIGAQLLQIGEHHRLVTALFAAAAIFLTFSVIPWLNERMNKDFQRSFNSKEDNESSTGQSLLDRAIELLLPGYKLTPREMEITALLLKGLINREIAEQLYISENTLKTHLRHIYPKFGVAQKRELLSLAADKSKDTPISGN
jgi:DNA-binding CsgD family transcriptional regulator